MLEWTWGNPLLSNFSNKPQQGYIETQPDAGLPFRRLAFSDIQDLVNASFSLTREEYLMFYSWYKFDLRQGTLPFAMYDCRYKIKRTARIVGDVPQFQANSNRQTLSLTIAFEPTVLHEDRFLTVNNGIPLIANTDDTLIVNYGIRL